MKKIFTLCLNAILVFTTVVCLSACGASKNERLADEIYDNLVKIHTQNIEICNEVYDGWIYSKSQRGSFSNTLYQQLEREHNIPFEFVLDYFDVAEPYNSADTYGRIKILDDIDLKLENDIVFVILKYHNNSIEEINSTLSHTKECLKDMKNNYEYYDILTELYSNEVQLNSFINKPDGTLAQLGNMIKQNEETYKDIIPKLSIEFD